MSASPTKAKAGAEQIDVRVSAVVPLNDLVTRFEFKRTRRQRPSRPFQPVPIRLSKCRAKVRTHG